VLPSPGKLDEQFSDDPRAASLAGPGWYEIPLDQPNFSSQAANVTPAGPALQFDANSGMAWKVWGIGNWEGDASPTSLHAMVSSLSGEFYLAYADFTTSRWQTLGPFMDSATAEYAAGGALANPQAYLSPMRRHYVALLVPEGSSLQLDLLELGVYSGGNFPAWVHLYEDHSSTTEIVFSWVDSTSSLSPDFAGYSIERRPDGGGSWQVLGSGLQRVPWFRDQEVKPDLGYFYRVNSWNLNGNMTPGLSRVYTAKAANNATPVVDFSLPPGPLAAPVQVTIDLSGSFDPDGTPISAYEFDFGGNPPTVSTPDPTLDITLQPGCYLMRFSATSNGSTGYGYARLVVYPRWSPDPVTVAAGNTQIGRVHSPQAVAIPGSDATTTFFFDNLQPGLMAVTTDAQGNTAWDMLPLYGDSISVLSEPAPTPGGVVFSVTQGGVASLVQWNGQNLEFLDFSGIPSGPGGSHVVSDGADGLWLLVFDWNGVSYDLILIRPFSGISEIIMPNMVAVVPVDAEYNAAADAIDIIIAGNSLNWMRRHSGGLYDSQEISPAATQSAELEQNPLTGRPEVVYHQLGTTFFSALNEDLLTWSNPQIVDIANANISGEALAHAGGDTFIAAADLALGTVRLYRRGDLLWEVVNTADDQNGGLALQLAWLESESRFRLYDLKQGGELLVKDFGQDDTESLAATVPRMSGNGLHMHAGRTAARLHVVNAMSGNIVHHSSSNGLDWIQENGAVATSLPRLCSGTGGSLFLSGKQGALAALFEWNGANFMNVTSLQASQSVVPMLSGEGLYQFAVDNNTNLPPYLRSYTAGGGAVNHALATLPIWDGHPVARLGNYSSVVVYGGATVDDAQFGYQSSAGSEVEFLYDGLSKFVLDVFVRTRAIDGCSFLEDEFLQARPCWYVAYGPELVPVRINLNLFDNVEMQNLPFRNVLFEPADIRRTVSVMEANGQTAVGFVTDNSGDERYLEWSNFGDWEQLPVPHAGLLSQGELALGPDGRWHLFFRDIITDEIKVISTL
jgi:hypothetical protein